MDIKEIALRIGLEVFEEHPYDNGHVVSPSGYTWIDDKLIEFAEALIESYKAELLNEVGEPVAVTNHAQLGYVTDGMHPDIPLAMWAKETSYSGANIALYTSDQVAAAILKATKPLEEEIERLSKLAYIGEHQFDDCTWKHRHGELRAQLAAAQEEIKTVTEQKNRMWFEMQTAQNQLAKAEQRVAEYNELIYAVQTKNPDETRHQTALRYIRNAENRPSNAVANGASI